MNHPNDLWFHHFYSLFLAFEEWLVLWTGLMLREWSGNHETEK